LTPWSISSQTFWPTSLMRKDVVAASGVEGEPERVAQPGREDLLARRAGVVGAVRHRAVPAPVNGLSAGIAPARVMRRILPLRMLRVARGVVAPAQPLSPL
jgi:hypothetical protein